MKLEEMTQTVSEKSGVERQDVRKVLETAFAMLGEELAKGEKVELQGLGTFVRKQNNKAGKKGKMVFKSWSAENAGIKKGNAGKTGKAGKIGNAGKGGPGSKASSAGKAAKAARKARRKAKKKEKGNAP
ncbi:MAG TPA: HU family DNA-binding protein [Rhizomicrobium sp.]